jgi:hypothetical protein
MKATIIGCAVVLLAGLPVSTAQAAEATCPTPEKTSEVVRLSDPGKWSYTYYVSWCVENGKVTSITPHVTHEEDSTWCSWVGSAEEAMTPVADGSGAWNAFNMSAFSCKDSAGKPGSVTPWAVITVRPNGSSSVPHKGVGD